MQVESDGSECYVIRASNGTFTVMIEGQFSTGKLWSTYYSLRLSLLNYTDTPVSEVNGSTIIIVVVVVVSLLLILVAVVVLIVVCKLCSQRLKGTK